MTVGRINHETNHDTFFYWGAIICHIFFYLLNSVISIRCSSVNKAASLLVIILEFSLTLTLIFASKCLSFKP